ncbi:glycogen debranching enzyme N-terminal domain-containing protein [Saccharicrinis sp. FJH54]|uniref:glycogen debranching enzyme N-terminal domain-containing protein n=1 Tax=Saccharicrinis sp. FJH54 TaxID=3344665 RepID=UPI0035D473A9
MSYLQFEKQDLINLEISLDKELLRTSRTGAYSCSTISGCNTRKYHGLLVCPVPGLDSDPHVLLSSLDETVVQHDSEFNLALHKFDHEHYSPKGHKYIREFECETIPKVTYRVGGVILTKEKVFISGEDRVLIKYTLIDAHSPVTMKFKPLLAFRNYHALSGSNMNVNHNHREIENGIATRMYDGYPELSMQFSKDVDYVPVPHWYYGVEYIKEQQRGYDFKEDLFAPGYFELNIKKGESIVFSAGTSEINTKGLKQKFTAEVKGRSPRNNFINCLKNSAHQFIVYKENRADIKAGFPWLPIRGRDSFIAMPGLSLSIGGTQPFRSTFKNVISDMNLYLDQHILPPGIQDYDAPDVLLWAAWSLQKLTSTIGLEFSNYETVYGKAIKYIIDGNVKRLNLHENGLLHVDGKHIPASWMNAVTDGKPSVYRSGYLVELNALWYNALCYYRDHCSPKCKQKKQIKEIIAKIEGNFCSVFKNGDSSGLYDFVDPDNNYRCKTIRPNMLFAVSLDYSPIEKDLQKKVLDVIEKNLLTPRGLRSLSPREPDFVGDLHGNQHFRDKYYFNGSVWPWLLGSFTDAYLKIYKNSGVHYLQSILNEFDHVMTHNCIGSVSEYYNGNPPHEGHGAISSAINVAELLRIAMKLQDLEKNKTL